jgi:hypothetical protein
MAAALRFDIPFVCCAFAFVGAVFGINIGMITRTIHHNIPDSHRFAIGNMVQLSRVIRLHNAVPGPYEILAQLPEREGEFQYRIKSDREPYQRIVKEDELKPT